MDNITFADNFASEDDNKIKISNEYLKINKQIIKDCCIKLNVDDIKVLSLIFKETMDYYMETKDDYYCYEMFNLLLNVKSHIFLKNMVQTTRLHYYNNYDMIMKFFLLDRMIKYNNANPTKRYTIYEDINYLFSNMSNDYIITCIINFIIDDDIKYIYTLEEILGDDFDDYIDVIIGQIVYNGGIKCFEYLHNNYGPFDINKLLPVFKSSMVGNYIADNIILKMIELGDDIINIIPYIVMWLSINCNLLNNNNVIHHLNLLMPYCKEKKIIHLVTINIIYNNNYIIFHNMMMKYYKHLTNVRLFCYVAKYIMNHNTDIIMKLYNSFSYTNEEMDDIFTSMCINNITIAIWIQEMNPYRYYFGLSKNEINQYIEWYDIDYNMTLPPIIYDNIKNIKNNINHSECSVCYDTTDSIIMPCHDSHMVCVSCFIKLNNNPKCPMCRSEYNIKDCSIYINNYF